MYPYTEFEEKIISAYPIKEASPEAKTRLRQALLTEQTKNETNRIWPKLFQPAWKPAVAILSLFVLSILAIGPTRVIAQIRSWMGFVPGVGLVDPSAPVRLLAEPISQTKDPVTVTIESLTSTSEATKIVFKVVGVPWEAMSKSAFALPNCNTSPYILLKDGSKLRTNALPNGLYGAIPADENDVKFIMPCILFTLPNTVPNHWEFDLKLVPAPEGTVLSVTEQAEGSVIIPSTPMAGAQEAPASLETDAQPPLPAENALVSAPEVIVKVLRYAETDTDYVLYGEYHTADPAKAGELGQRMLEVFDEEGQVLFLPVDDTGGGLRQSDDLTKILWEGKLSKQDLHLPLRIGLSYSLGNSIFTDPMVKESQSFVYWQPGGFSAPADQAQVQAPDLRDVSPEDFAHRPLAAGTQLLYRRTVDHVPQILSYTVGEHEPRLVVPIGGDYATLSPDGSQLAYLEGNEMNLLDLDSGAILYRESAIDQAYWKANGEAFAYTYLAPDTQFEIRVVDSAGQEQSRLPFNAKTLKGWSADGEALLLLASIDDTWVLQRVDPRSGNVLEELTLPSLEIANSTRHLAVSPDSKQLAYTDKAWQKIFILDLETMESTLISDGANFSSFSWLNPYELAINYQPSSKLPAQSLIYDLSSASITRMPALVQGKLIGLRPKGSMPGQALLATPTPPPPSKPMPFINQVDRVTETETGYILEGSVHPAPGSEGFYAHPYGPPRLHDKNSGLVAAYVPEDLRQNHGAPLEDGGFTWVLELEEKDFAYPVTINFMGFTSQNPSADAPQAGTAEQWKTDWQPNQP